MDRPLTQHPNTAAVVAAPAGGPELVQSPRSEPTPA